MFICFFCLSASPYRWFQFNSNIYCDRILTDGVMEKVNVYLVEENFTLPAKWGNKINFCMLCRFFLLLLNERKTIQISPLESADRTGTDPLRITSQENWEMKLTLSFSHFCSSASCNILFFWSKMGMLPWLNNAILPNIWNSSVFARHCYISTLCKQNTKNTQGKVVGFPYCAASGSHALQEFRGKECSEW